MPTRSSAAASQRSVDCVADDVTAMKGQYATGTETALQRFAIERDLGAGHGLPDHDAALFELAGKRESGLRRRDQKKNKACRKGSKDR